MPNKLGCVLGESVFRGLRHLRAQVWKNRNCFYHGFVDDQQSPFNLAQAFNMKDRNPDNESKLWARRLIDACRDILKEFGLLAEVRDCSVVAKASPCFLLVCWNRALFDLASKVSAAMLRRCQVSVAVQPFRLVVGDLDTEHPRCKILKTYNRNKRQIDCMKNSHGHGETVSERAVTLPLSGDGQ